jgi:hypothetical protein
MQYENTVKRRKIRGGGVGSLGQAVEALVESRTNGTAARRRYRGSYDVLAGIGALVFEISHHLVPD